MTESIGSATAVADDWLMTQLTDDSLMGDAFDIFPVAAFDALAPENTPYPFIVFQCQDSLDTNGVGPDARIMVECTYIVRAIARVDSFTDPILTALVAAIDTAIVGSGGTATGGQVLGVQRQDEYRQIENEDGRQIRHLGGRYTVWVQTT